MLAVRPLAVLVVASSLVIACSSEGDESSAAASDSVSVSVSTDTGDAVSPPAAASAPGESKPSFVESPNGAVSMRTTNGALVMSLRHDSVVVAFSDSISRHVKAELKNEMAKDSSEKDGGAFAEVMKGVVEKSVSAGLSEVFDKARGFPVSALRGIAYEHGAIRFDYVEKPTWTFDNFKTDETPLLEQFHPADAARFVGAVRARLKQS